MKFADKYQTIDENDPKKQVLDLETFAIGELLQLIADKLSKIGRNK